MCGALKLSALETISLHRHGNPLQWRDAIDGNGGKVLPHLGPEGTPSTPSCSDVSRFHEFEILCSSGVTQGGDGWGWQVQNFAADHPLVDVCSCMARSTCGDVC